MEPLQYEKRGYLKEDFRLFYLSDRNTSEIAYHYHNFHKIILLLAGKANYSIEGERYALAPGDFVLVTRGSIHRPELEPDTFYERMILYISPECLSRYSTEACDLSLCFQRAQSEFQYVYHTAGDEPVPSLFRQLYRIWSSGEFGHEILRRSLFLQLMVEVNRAARNRHSNDAVPGDRKIVAILQYLNLHLTEELSIDRLAGSFYISKFYMMRRFKEETGYTIHGYITEKRLLLAQQQLQQGASLSDACYLSGYQDYSTFSRAYKKRFGEIPSAYLLHH